MENKNEKNSFSKWFSVNVRSHQELKSNPSKNGKGYLVKLPLQNLTTFLNESQFKVYEEKMLEDTGETIPRKEVVVIPAYNKNLVWEIEGEEKLPSKTVYGTENKNYNLKVEYSVPAGVLASMIKDNYGINISDDNLPTFKEEEEIVNQGEPTETTEEEIKEEIKEIF
jgi:hypothetical protein